MEQLRVDVLWQLGYTGAGIRVGHLDTGLDHHHPSLRHQPAAFQSFDRKGFVAQASEPFDSEEHGTLTASILCGLSVNGTVIGVAPDCSLYSGQVLEHGDIISRILFGMAWLLECGVRVICLPLGVPGHTPVFGSMIRLLRQREVLTIAPIGNRGPGRSLSPGDYPDVLSVGADDSAGGVARFSGSFHPSGLPTCTKPDLVAPGTEIPSARPGGGYRHSSGTSAACALVAGVAALLIQAAPTAPISLIEAALMNTSAPLRPDHAHRSRRGLIRPEAALHYVLTHQERWPLAGGDDVAADVSHEFNAAPPRYIDPRLEHDCRYASEDSLLEAVFVVSGDVADQGNDSRGAAGVVVDRVTRTRGEVPQRSRFIAAANVAIIQAKAPLIRSLMHDSSVTVASATDVNQALLS